MFATFPWQTGYCPDVPYANYIREFVRKHYQAIQEGAVRSCGIPYVSLASHRRGNTCNDVLLDNSIVNTVNAAKACTHPSSITSWDLPVSESLSWSSVARILQTSHLLAYFTPSCSSGPDDTAETRRNAIKIAANISLPCSWLIIRLHSTEDFVILTFGRSSSSGREGKRWLMSLIRISNPP